MAEVQLEKICKTYNGDVEAVKDLDLTVADGEFLALLGPSGCGKTSTLRMIVGLEEITSGTLRIGGRVVNDLEPSERNVALAFETYALYPPLTVRDNIAFCLRARGLPRQEVRQRVEAVAKMLDIASILDRKPGELGGGQKQRVSLARALVRNPDVFLMDEPLSHLDATQRAFMRVELKRMHAETRRTTILVTHDQLEAVAMAERIAVMKLGVLQQVGTFDEIYNRPANEFVAGFIGEPPMNMFTCEPEAQGGDLRLRAIDGSFQITLPPRLRQAVNGNAPERVRLGIRPTHMRAASTPSDNGTVEIPASVYTYEALGEEGQLAAHVGDETVLVVTDYRQSFERGENVWMQMDIDHIHLFHADTGVSLTA